ncbi:MAG: hypothetical protein DMG21_11990 [Acidobacteria bacterium]|nr:MAG: hypothetical protein DMG21_11990 [Acidobacteriota bacterium]
MGFAPGTRLGPYEILVPLGAGGMGEVYRARDTKLGRDVALKVLPANVARDPDRMARFGREAQVLASLNHPNIAAIYGLEESGGVRALVMELVEGPTLAELLEKTKLETRNSKFEIRREFRFSSFEVRTSTYRQTDRRSARSGARTRDRSPRPETCQHQDHPRRHGQGSRLWPCQGVRS